MITRPVHRPLWMLVGALALVASALGVADPGIYTGLVPPSVLPGAVGQDVVSIAAGILLLAIGAIGARRPRLQLVALGLVGYFVYAYGVYAIERVYNPLYLVYLLVFSLSVWALVAAAVDIAARPTVLRPLPAAVRVPAAVGALLQPLVFIPLWVSALLPLIARRDQVDSLYSIYILDLCFVMPAFLLAAVLLLRRRGAGTLLGAALFVLGAALMASLVLSALLAPLFGQPASLAALVPPAVLTVLFAVLAVLTLRFVPARTSSDAVRPPARRNRAALA